MSDDMMKSGEEQIVPEGTVAPRPAPPLIKPGMARRNVLLIVAGIIVLVVAAGFVAYALYAANSTPTPTAVTPTVPTVPVTPGGTTTAPSTTPSANLPAVADITDRDVFTPRNPFNPIAAITISTSDDSSSTANDTSNTLHLTDIITDNGVRKAVVTLNGTSYTLAAGEAVGSSDWSIVEVHANSIVALFGDQRVTISLGEGSSK